MENHLKVPTVTSTWLGQTIYWRGSEVPKLHFDGGVPVIKTMKVLIERKSKKPIRQYSCILEH